MKRCMAERDRWALRCVLIAENPYFQEWRPRRKKLIAYLVGKYPFRTTHNGLREVFRNLDLKYKWKPRPERDGIPKKIVKAVKVISNVVEIHEQLNKQLPTLVPEQLKDNWDSLKNEQLQIQSQAVLVKS